MEEMAEKERLRKEVAQLRREAALERMKVNHFLLNYIFNWRYCKIGQIRNH